MTELNVTVLKLVSLHQEGEYWDFKKEWPTNGSLLHDIICMSNNTAFTDGLIIIGIDEECGFIPVDIQGDPNRKNTQMVTDFLSAKPFAGGIRPVAVVETVFIEDYEVDVLSVRASRNVPFYLEKPYRQKNDDKQFAAGSIYSRICDTNTPINSTADHSVTEKLWNHHFCYDGTPYERFERYLTENENWVDSYGRYEGLREFYRVFPEFTIEHISNNDLTAPEYYNFLMCDTRPSWYEIYLRYYETVIEHFQATALDGGRYFTPVPERSFFHTPTHEKLGEAYSYCYFVKDSFLYRLHQHCYKASTDDERIAHDDFLRGVVIYESNDERQAIKKLIEANPERFDKRANEVMIAVFFPDRCTQTEKRLYHESLRTVRVIQEMLEKYRGIPYVNKMYSPVDYIQCTSSQILL